jgi:hypothetical protein
MITDLKCKKIKETSWKDRIKECCEEENPEDPRGCDCCYDLWKEELRGVNTKYSEAEEEARLISAELIFITGRRDKLKTWYDELTKANDLSRSICEQLEVMLSQIEKISLNTKHAVRAINLLYCMIRDFYMQIDLIKLKYDQIMNCIRCLNEPALAPGQGVVKCLEDYGKKLEALMNTRDELLKMMMAAIYLAYRINKNIALDFGLYLIIQEWETTLNCAEDCSSSTSGGYSDKNNRRMKEGYGYEEEYHHKEEEKKGCQLTPVLEFPICNDPYYDSLRNKYEVDKARAAELSKKLIDLNKKKESLLACKQSLTAAIQETAPRTRCK